MNCQHIKTHLYPLLALALPLALTGIMQSLDLFFETIFFAHVSHDVLAAGALVGWLFGTLIVMLFGTLSSINILIAHKYGAADHKGISLVVRDGLRLALLLSPFIFVIFWYMPAIFTLFGQSPAIVALAKSYLHAIAWGILPKIFIITLIELLLGLGRSKAIMAFSGLGIVLSLFWSYVLIFGAFGFPALGIAGAGWGMSISNWLVLGALASYTLRNKRYQGYFGACFNFQKPSFLLELFHVGIPIGAMYCVEVGFFLALALLMGSFNSQLLAANQVVMQYLCILTSIIFSIAQAITVRMGHLLGAGQNILAQYAAHTGVYISAIFMLIIALCYWFLPSLLISVDFDINDPHNASIIQQIKELLAISALFQIFEAIRLAYFGALRALKDTRFTLLTSVLSFWGIALPLGYLLATTFKLSGQGLWWGMVIGAFFSVLLLHWRFKSKITQYILASTISPRS